VRQKINRKGMEETQRTDIKNHRTCPEELADREEQTAQRGIRARFILNRKAFQGTQRKAQFSKK
jgi:hypothetical protein